MRERIVMAMAVALLFLPWPGLWQSSTGIRKSGMDECTFWALKISAAPVYDVVLAGDSRVYIGISPRVMGQLMPGYQILNFAFQGNGYSQDYLDQVPTRLNPDRPRRIIVLGLTPRSLTPNSSAANGFNEARKLGRVSRWMDIHLGPELSYLAPFPLQDVLRIVKGQPPNYFYDFQADGWVAAKRVPPDPELELKTYRDFFRAGPVSSLAVDRIINATREWRRQGYLVFGFRPPTGKAIREIEDELSGLDDTALIARFQDAGGVWLQFDMNQYHTYDGSHLEPDSAVIFSRDLAQALMERLPSVPPK